jgi:hypothetical protein
MIAFTRRHGANAFLVMASLNNHPFLDGYVVQTEPDRLASGLWQEIFNSDAALYGGSDIGNFGAAIPSEGGASRCAFPRTASSSCRSAEAVGFSGKIVGRSRCCAAWQLAAEGKRYARLTDDIRIPAGRTRIPARGPLS